MPPDSLAPDPLKVLRFEALKKTLAAAGNSGARSRPAEVWPTGCPSVDEAVGGLRKGGINEFCGSTGSGALLLEALLREADRAGWYLALVDAADAFDPTQYAGALLRRMLWVRCQEARQAVRVADLLVRDGNLPLIVLDLQAAGTAGVPLRGVPSSTWHRYARLMESGGGLTTLLVLSRRPMVEGAALRLHCENRWSPEGLGEPREALAAAMRWRFRERSGNRWAEGAECSA